jgi:hypothetical protein
METVTVKPASCNVYINRRVSALVENRYQCGVGVGLRIKLHFDQVRQGSDPGTLHSRPLETTSNEQVVAASTHNAPTLGLTLPKRCAPTCVMRLTCCRPCEILVGAEYSMLGGHAIREPSSGWGIH